MSDMLQERGGRWVPAIPIRAPWHGRWCCPHKWTPHVHASGETSPVDYDCMRCGASTEAGGPPADGLWPARSWIAHKILFGWRR